MNNCDDCNYYTEKYNFEKRDNIPYCVKLDKEINDNEIDNNESCKEYNDEMNCYDCPNSYELYYEIDDIDHYCKVTNKLICQQRRSVLYKGDFDKCTCK